MPQASTLNEACVAGHLAAFDFAGLFVGELGWSNPKQPAPFTLDPGGDPCTLTEVAQLSGVGVFEAAAADGSAGGTQKRRSELRRELARLHAEHLLIFVDAGRTRSVWHWANREVGGDGKVATKVFEEEFARGQSTDKLRAALDAMVFDVADFEDGDPSIVEVTRRLRRGLKVEDVTKRFFRQFADERRAFAAFIKGLGREGQRGEYTAVLLDRLMFCYFLQHKGFLGGGDTRYLGRALEQSRSRGKDRYYADFLRPLFFDGFARREAERGPGVRRLIGQVPYLNGGLFEPHRIERDTEAAGRPLAVPDAAFEALFDFFDGWRWTLDTRPLRSGREINPDVLGYIFEQFINYTERKENGSYYTKEDVTGYIARSTLLPWWLDRAAELAGHKPDTKAAKPLDLFAPGGPAHALLTADPVAYLWPEVRKGVLDAAGRELPPPRDWSAPATAEEAAAHPHALATETRLEFDARRRRCLDAHARVGSGGVASADDLVTLNLDLPRLCRDLAAGADAPLAHAMALALDGLTVLDPTCGSGAFLFAALNLLDPLAAAVDDRLRRHLDAGDLDPDLRHRFAARLQPADGSVAPEGYRRLKRLVVGNLFGVDLMPEAVEICKLRLFLRLVAELDDPAHVEPLPDIDFNVRRGNTLVGLATPAELRQSVFGTAEYDEIERGLVAASRHLVAFRHAQELGVESREPKENYRLALRRVADGLDGRLFAEQAPKGMKRDEFVATRRPFHWPAEFHDIMRDGGFACVIGNPPYVKASDVRKEYGIQGYRTDRVPDVYAVVMERCSDLVRRPGASGASPGRFGMIVPLSLAFSSRFRPIRRVLADDYAVNWFASFARIPAGLFDGDVRVRNTIHLARRASADHRTPVGLRPAFATVLHRWFEQARPHLFANLHYVAFDPRLFHTKQFDTKVKAADRGDARTFDGVVPRFNTARTAGAFQSLLAGGDRKIAAAVVKGGRHVLHFKKTAYNWLAFSYDQPPSFDLKGKKTPQTQYDRIAFAEETSRDLAFLFLNGKLQLLYWCVVGDDFHVTRWMFDTFPLDLSAVPEATRRRLLSHVGPLREAMAANVSFKLNAKKRVGSYNLARCRHVTDATDRIWAEHLGLTEVWADLELLYAQVVKTDFDLDEGDDAEGDDDA